MKSTYTLLPSLGSLLSLVTGPALALELKPISAPQAGLDARSVDYSSLNLQSAETFLWGGSNDNRAAIANFTVLMPGQKENIINIERFKGLVTSMECSENSTALKLKDNEAFTRLMSAWDWTNEDPDHTFVMVAGSGDCISQDSRQPFVTTAVSFDKTTNTATLTGHKSDWKSVAHSYHLHIGGLPKSDLAKRDYTGNYALNFTHDINMGSWTIPVDDGLQVTFNCASCKTTGEFDFTFDISTTFGIPDGASVTLNPNDVSAVIDPTISLAGELSGKKSYTDKFLTIPIDGISVADIVDLGPAIAFSGSLNIGPLKGTASVQPSVTLALNNDADFEIDLLSPSNCKADNWSPNVTAEEPTLSAMISGGVSLGLLADVEFDISVLGRLNTMIS
ncbi:hypothetical protein BGW36DRAFT_305975 [Talaromyces proteolyticus]|uniref:Uncharacterized protein n=1 Tax=Talaromyces proteolyticus TaxID=1131652 RepID=A0AAD4KKT2_9EURO|nr:uncharacterized protein BGW36DRAFT_305975 [Talaromyces proteolyticus]KAH8690703.1 hypothetical protein BGW36DRAFT_305975 [Talaromyces proteolyticus]